MTRLDENDAAQIREAATIDDRLDDVRRARIWTQLDRALDREDARGPGPRLSRRWLMLGGVALAAAIGLAVWVTAGWTRRDALSGTAGAADAEVLDIPPGATARAQLGDAAAVTLYGPTRVALDETEGRVDVMLERGTIAGDYDHARGGTMRIRTPHAVVEIVGTVFAVDVTDRTCVAVAEGVVRVRAGRSVRDVRAGESWCAGDLEARAIPPLLDERMTDHLGRLAAATPPEPPRIETTEPDPPSGPAVAAEPPRRAQRAAPSQQAVLPDPLTTPGDDRTPMPEAAPAVGRIPAAPVMAPDAELYATAEHALRYNDTTLADALLARLIVDHPDSALVDEALFERARLAYESGAWTAARDSLQRLLEMKASPLRASAQFLACRIAVRTRDRDAGRCLDELRSATADARVAIEALELRIEVAFEQRGCAAARPYVDELVAAAPARPAVKTWRTRCAAGETR